MPKNIENVQLYLLSESRTLSYSNPRFGPNSADGKPFHVYAFLDSR